MSGIDDLLTPGTVAELDAIRAELRALDGRAYEIAPTTLERHTLILWIDRRTTAPKKAKR